jgi:hypothetical protein
MTCLGTLLSIVPVNDPAAWGTPAMGSRLGFLCNGVSAGSLQVRVAAGTALQSTLKAHNQNVRHAAAGVESSAAATSRVALTKASEAADAVGRMIASHCGSVVSSATSKTALLAQRVAQFLEAVAPVMPSAALDDLVASLLRGPGSGVASVGQTCMRALATIFESPRTRISLGLVRKVAEGMAATPVSVSNPAVAAEFARALAAASVRLVATVAERQAGAGSGVGDMVLNLASGALSLGRLTEESVAQAMSIPLTEELSSLLPTVVGVIGAYFVPSGRSELHRQAAGALAMLFSASINHAVVAQSAAVVEADPLGAMNALSIASGVRTDPSTGRSIAATRGGSLIERVAAVLEASLTVDKQAVWPFVAPLAALLFRLCGLHALPLLQPLLLRLVACRDAIIASQGGEPEKIRVGDEEDFSSDDDEEGGTAESRAVRRETKKAARITFVTIERAIAACLVAGGAPAFLAVVPLDTSASGALGVSDDRLWLLRMLRRNLRYTRTPLSFFFGPVLTAARIAATAATAESKAGRDTNSRLLTSRALQLWGLFPQACAAPPDAATAFHAENGKRLVAAIKDVRFPELKRVVASGLGVLISRHLLAAGEAMPVKPAFMGEAAQGGGGSWEDGRSAVTFMGGISAFDLEGGASFLGSAAGSVGGDDDLLFGEDGDDLFGSGSGGDGKPRAMGPSLVDSVAANHPSLAAALGKGARPPKLDHDTAVAGLEAIRGLASNFLPVLFEEYELAASINASTAQRLLESIAAYFAVAPETVVNGFASRLKGLLTTALGTVHGSSTDSSSALNVALARAGSLLSLSMTMASRLNEAQCSDLFELLRPCLGGSSLPQLQKRAYKVSCPHPF